MDKEKVLSLLLLLLLAGSASAGSNDTAKIALHLQAVPTGKAPSVCDRAPLPPCTAGDSSLAVVGDLNTPYDLYVLVLDGSALAGVGGAAFGIEYGPGVVVSGWTLCADLDFSGAPQGSQWPDSGSGNLLTWNVTTNCQNTPAEGDLDYGVTAVLGALHVYSYAAETISITPRNYAPTPDFSVTDCTPERSDPPYPDNAGRVAFGQVTGGYDPCSPPDTIPPAQITNLALEEATGLSSSDLLPVITWTAPGDDGPLGNASYYDIRYSQDVLNEDTWDRAFKVTPPLPIRSGQIQRMVIDLAPNSEYNIAIKTYDEVGNRSNLSNVVNVRISDNSSFEIAVSTNHLTIWLAGQRIEPAPSFNIQYKNEVFSINSVELMLRRQTSTAARSYDYERDIPFVSALLDRGIALPTASLLFNAKIDELIDVARHRYVTFGPTAALNTFVHSPLVTKASAEDGWMVVRFQGSIIDAKLQMPSKITSDVAQPKTPACALIATRLAEKIETWADASQRDPVIIFISTSGGLETVYGDGARLADKQALFVQGGGDVAAMPSGPLTPHSPVIKDILRRAMIESCG